MSQSLSVVTLGCKTNQFESAAMAEQLQQAGYCPVDFEAGADLVLINTCTVTAATDSQSRNLIRRARRLNPGVRIIVTGCYAQIDPQSLCDLPGVSLVVGNQEKSQLLELLLKDDAQHKVHVGDIRAQESFEPLEINTFEQRSRAFVQIQNGCDAFCAYCIIPYARGRSRSASIEEVVGQVERLSAAGYPELVLTGIHIGQYGLDLQPKTDLLGLLRAIEDSAFSGRLRLGSIEPNELNDELLRYIASAGWICPHLHIPLQAGENSVLQRMNRHYSCEDYAALLDRVHELIPDAAVGLDIIAGFPGETDEQFESTVAFLKELNFSHLHVFPFSRRQGTPAAQMGGQLPGDVIKERAARLREVGDEKNLRYRSSFIGRSLELVIEGGSKAGLQKGLAENYLSVWISADGYGQGQVVAARVTGLFKDGLEADPV